MSMNNAHYLFCKSALNMIPFFKSVAEEYVMERWPDEPLWTLMYEDFGVSTIEHFDDLTIEQRSKIFELIENSLYSDDLSFKNSIAAGFVEGVIYALNKEPRLWSDVEVFFLPVTRELFLKQTN